MLLTAGPKKMIMSKSCIMKDNKFNPPWISAELIQLCRKKKHLFRKAK